MKPLVKPDVARELSRLKNFQRDTVEHIFSRMYDPVTPTRRFLVADEVGLGKTLVARGLVAKVVDQLWDSVGRIDVIYICSNGSIARQNINRLNVSVEKDATLPSRITLPRPWFMAPGSEAQLHLADASDLVRSSLQPRHIEERALRTGCFQMTEDVITGVQNSAGRRRSGIIPLVCL